jgi:dihydroorotate dehydrogenase
MIYKTIAKPILFRKDAEDAHNSAINLSKTTSNSSLLRFAAKALYQYKSERLHRSYFGLNFPNPLGLAAGFDKNGTTPIAMQALGFGFVEIGSITAKPSQGNPRPRAFRLPKDQSLINRMGLNNQGATEIIKRLKKVSLSIPLGVNIAKTNDPTIHGEDAIQDYVFSFKLAEEVADYITVNISCPNTGEGKTFEDPAALEALLKAINPAKSNIPVLVKFSSDTDESTLKVLIDLCEQNGISGYVATNTSNNRSGLQTSDQTLNQIGNGGLSGKAISDRSNQVIRWIRSNTDKPIIGVGGITDSASALEKLDAGANLLQVYTGLVYEGPALIKNINKAIETV